VPTRNPSPTRRLHPLEVAVAASSALLLAGALALGTATSARAEPTPQTPTTALATLATLASPTACVLYEDDSFVCGYVKWWYVNPNTRDLEPQIDWARPHIDGCIPRGVCDSDTPSLASPR
jgi:hypothetical protein